MLPMVAFYLEGTYKGIFVIALFFIGSILSSILHLGGIIQLPYSSSYIFVFHAALLVNSILMHFIHRIIFSTERDLHQKIREVNELNSRLEYYAFFDTLTGIYNRRQIIMTLSNEIDRYSRNPAPLSILLFDLDNFKQINDTYGHIFGDYVLKTLAKSINENILRRSDSIGRYGGEEFMIILHDTNLEGGTIAAERIRQHVEELVFYSKEHDTIVPVRLSIGVTDLASEKDSPDSIIRRADIALYDAKHNGRNRVSTFDINMNSTI
jgi:diguanylate cyclase (GGDEF)-like protein